MNLGQRIKQASKRLYLTDSFITLHSLYQELAHFNLALYTEKKNKLELNHVIWVAVNKHVFGETKFTYLRVTSMCSQYIVAVNSKLGRVKDKESSYLGNNCFLFRIIFGSKNKHWTKSGQKLGPAENWAQYWILYSPPSPMAMGTHSYSNVLVSWGLDRNTKKWVRADEQGIIFQGLEYL